MKITDISTIDKSLAKTKEWLEEVMLEIAEENPEKALKKLRITLQMVRDRCNVNEAIQLGDQLPLFIKGFYYESWKPTAVSKGAKDIVEFMDPMYREFPSDDPIDLDVSVKGIFNVLQRHVSGGEMDDVLANFPKEIKEFFNEGAQV